MSHRDTILAALASLRRPICDDCLSLVTRISPRQKVFANCSELAAEGRITRQRLENCHRCGKSKICNSPGNLARLASALPSSVAAPGRPVQAAADSARPWHWEGNVQAALIEQLVQDGWSIRSAANTATKAAGKDIVATRGGKELWVSVKGYPVATAKTPASMQARHWFSHAIFDACMYRDQSDEARIAVAFPDGYKTYLALATRIKWLRGSIPLQVFWIARDGQVRAE